MKPSLQSTSLSRQDEELELLPWLYALSLSSTCYLQSTLAEKPLSLPLFSPSSRFPLLSPSLPHSLVLLEALRPVYALAYGLLCTPVTMLTASPIGATYSNGLNELAVSTHLGLSLNEYMVSSNLRTVPQRKGEIAMKTLPQYLYALALALCLFAAVAQSHRAAGLAIELEAAQNEIEDLRNVITDDGMILVEPAR